MTMNRDLNLLGEFILDVLKYDVMEQVSNVREMLNDRGSVGWRLNWPADFTDDEIIGGFRILIQRGFVKVLEEDPAVPKMRELDSLDESRWHDYWYSMTDLGRRHSEAWKPPPRIGYDELE